MFANLSQGNVLYGLDTKESYKIFAAPITKVSNPYPGYINQNGVQVPTMVVDIIATINGENQEFKQVPSNISIADFGKGSYVLADNRDSLNVHVKSKLDDITKILSNVENIKVEYDNYSKAYQDLNPSTPTNNGSSAIEALNKRMDNIDSKFDKILTLLESNTNPKNE